MSYEDVQVSKKSQRAVKQALGAFWPRAYARFDFPRQAPTKHAIIATWPFKDPAAYYLMVFTSNKTVTRQHDTNEDETEIDTEGDN